MMSTSGNSDSLEMEEETEVRQKRMTLLPPSWKRQPFFLPDTHFIQHNEFQVNFSLENEYRLEIRTVTKCLFLGSMRLKPVPLKSPEMILELGRLMESPVNARVMPLDLSLDPKTSEPQQAERECSASPKMDYAMFDNPPDIECEQNMEILGHEIIELPDQEESHFGESSSVLEFCGMNQESDSNQSDPVDDADDNEGDTEMKGLPKQPLNFTTAEALEQYTQAMAYIQMMRSTIQMSMQPKKDESARPVENRNVKKYLKRTPKCKICSQIFTSYVKLRKHKLEHDGDKPYICKNCEKSHATLDQLIAHMRIHEGKRPYICKKCTKTFKTAKALEEHQAVHVLRKEVVVPKKIFQCEICNKEFRKLCDLERHTRVHTGEKPSVCNICNRRFQQAHNLNKHLLIHTQVKPFQCDICKKKFGRNDVLNRHLLTHSVKKPNDCSFCGKTFIRGTQLVAHVEKYHSSS